MQYSKNQGLKYPLFWYLVQFSSQFILLIFSSKLGFLCRKRGRIKYLMQYSKLAVVPFSYLTKKLFNEGRESKWLFKQHNLTRALWWKNRVFSNFLIYWDFENRNSTSTYTCLPTWVTLSSLGNLWSLSHPSLFGYVKYEKSSVFLFPCLIQAVFWGKFSSLSKFHWDIGCGVF